MWSSAAAFVVFIVAAAGCWQDSSWKPNAWLIIIFIVYDGQ